MNSRSRLVRLVAAMTAGLLAAAALTAPAEAAGTGSVEGTFATSDGRPIAGASVSAWSGAEDRVADPTTTDDTGHYRLAGVPAGEIKLRFDDHGLEQWSPGQRDYDSAAAYTVADGGTLTVDERQLQTGTIAGHFTDASGQPAFAGVTAQGLDYSGSHDAATDETGAYRIDVLPGAYRVTFRWESARQFAYRAADESAAATITVTAGETTTVDDQKLPTGTVGGRLTAADGSPLPEASVLLHRGGEVAGAAMTDADGAYSFGEALAGDGYTVSFSVGGGAEQWVPQTLDQAAAQQFTVVAGEHTTVDDTQLVTATVHGRLVDGDGNPAAGYHVSVTLADENNWVNYNGDTDHNGEWSISGVFPGDYRVSFQTPDWGRTQWAYGSGTESGATLITVAPGASVTVDDTWLPAATLVVQAVDATTGAPVSDFCVWVFTPGDGRGCTTSGQVTVADLPAGSFRMSVTPDQSGYYLPSGDELVTLTVGQTSTVSVPLTLGGKIAFTATDRTTRVPVSNTCAAFQVLGQGGLPDGYEACTGTAGTAISVTKAAGTYELFAIAPGGYGHQWVGKSGGTGDQRAAARIAVKPGTTVRAPAVLLDQAGTITGVVTDAAGTPLGGNVAFSAWGDAGPAWTAEIDANGRYTLGKLGPYAWPLLFDAPGYPRQWSGHEGNRFKADTVAVVAGGTTTYDFTPAKGATLNGTVSVPVPTTNWRLNVVNAVTGDQMGVFDGYEAGPGGSYSLALIGDQTVKIGWSYYWNGTTSRGWYDDDADITSAKKVTIPEDGTLEVNLKMG